MSFWRTVGACFLAVSIYNILDLAIATMQATSAKTRRRGALRALRSWKKARRQRVERRAPEQEKLP